MVAYFRARPHSRHARAPVGGWGVRPQRDRSSTTRVRHPALVADDLYVDELFERSEIDVVATDPVEVRCPRTWRALLATLRRVQAGRAQLSELHDIVQVGGLRPLLAGVRGPASLADAAVYVGFSILARMLSRSGRNYWWYRDETNRHAAAPIRSRCRSVDHNTRRR